MTLPNFLIIGAGKSGTTALYEYLKQHPQVYMSPVKEPRFFAFEGESVNFGGPWGERLNPEVMAFNSIASYSALFEDVEDETAIGEASPIYLWAAKAAARIHRRVPDARLIAILRDPVERAY